jgi:hypothetical protein
MVAVFESERERGWRGGWSTFCEVVDVVDGEAVGGPSDDYHGGFA